MLSMLAMKDIAERALRTAAQAFLGTYGLELTDVMSLDMAEKGALTAAAAVLAAVMGVISTRLGSSTDDASMR